MAAFPRLEIAAIGAGNGARRWPGTVITPGLQPEAGFTSEALLTLPRFQQVAGQAIVIVRGEGGRELLAETLTRRGARVVHTEVYRRERPMADATALLERWARGEIDAVIVTSTETLLNLFDMLGIDGQDYLRKRPMIAASARIRAHRRNLGCHQLQLAREASNDAIARRAARPDGESLPISW